MFNPTPQARPVPAAVDLACGIGLNDQNFVTALGEALVSSHRHVFRNALAY